MSEPPDFNGPVCPIFGDNCVNNERRFHGHWCREREARPQPQAADNVRICSLCGVEEDVPPHHAGVSFGPSGEMRCVNVEACDIRQKQHSNELGSKTPGLNPGSRVRLRLAPSSTGIVDGWLSSNTVRVVWNSGWCNEVLASQLEPNPDQSEHHAIGAGGNDDSGYVHPDVLTLQSPEFQAEYVQRKEVECDNLCTWCRRPMTGHPMGSCIGESHTPIQDPILVIARLRIRKAFDETTETGMYAALQDAMRILQPKSESEEPYFTRELRAIEIRQETPLPDFTVGEEVDLLNSPMWAPSSRRVFITRMELCDDGHIQCCWIAEDTSSGGAPEASFRKLPRGK